MLTATWAKVERCEKETVQRSRIDVCGSTWACEGWACEGWACEGEGWLEPTMGRPSLSSGPDSTAA